MKTVSVVIPTFNYARFLGSAIDSVLAQTKSALELIVVDDGSTDDTRSVMADYGARIRGIHTKNGGISTARNIGIEAATGELIAILDADDRWLPAKLDRQVAHFEQDPDLGLVHCAADYVRLDERSPKITMTGMEGWVADDLLGLDRQVVAAPGSTPLFPKRVWKEVGGDDPSLRSSEDWDFHYRVARRYRFGYVPEVLVQYLVHGGGLHFNFARTEEAMLIGLAKAFRDEDPHVAGMRGRAFGSLHRMLAGSYFQAGQSRQFVKHALRSVGHNPANLLYLAAYPLRALRRMRNRS